MAVNSTIDQDGGNDITLTSDVQETSFIENTADDMDYN